MVEGKSGVQAASLPVWLVGCVGGLLCFVALNEDQWIAGSLFLLASAVAFGALLRALLP